jgi:hypothetical protein
MNRSLILSPVLPLALLGAGCAERAPSADPVAVEQLAASFEAAPAAAESKAKAPAVAKSIEKADRLTGALVRIEPERIDPNLAAALIAR